MNEVQLAAARAALDNVEARARDHLEVTMWAKGQLLQHIHSGDHHKTGAGGKIPNHLAELLPGTSTDAGAEALLRFARMAKSIAPRILRLKRYGTIGSINWGDGDPTFDATLDGQTHAALDAFPLNKLGRKAVEQDLIAGMMVGIAIPNGNGGARVQPLGGYVEPLAEDDDVDSVWGIFQAWIPAGSTRWSARVYNLETRELFEYQNLDRPSAIGIVPEPTANAPMPVFEIVDTDLDGLPRGEFAESLPLFKSEWSSQVRGDRAEESTAFSQLVIKGMVENGVNERGPTRAIRLPTDGDAKYLDPPSLEQIHAHHDRKLERLQKDHALPGGFLGRQTPSGEALREANQSFIADCAARAKRISSYLTRLVADYGEIVGLPEPPQVSVTINREFERASVVEQTVLLVREGLLEFGEAVRTISVYYPTWKSADVEAYILAQREIVPPEPSPAEAAEDEE